jgi:hypothetical protein
MLYAMGTDVIIARNRVIFGVPAGVKMTILMLQFPAWDEAAK